MGTGCVVVACCTVAVAARSPPGLTPSGCGVVVWVVRVVRGCAACGSGSLRFDKKTKSLWLRCVDGWLRCARMQVTGRQVVSGADFASGYVLGKANAAKPGLVRLVSRIS